MVASSFLVISADDVTNPGTSFAAASVTAAGTAESSTVTGSTTAYFLRFPVEMGKRGMFEEFLSVAPEDF